MGRDQENKLFIGGLSYSTEDKSLREYFERFGPLSDYVVMRYPDTTRRSRGFGFVSFDNKSDMENCLASQPHNLDGRTVELKQATPKEDMGGGRSGGFSAAAATTTKRLRTQRANSCGSCSLAGSTTPPQRRE